MKPVMRRLIALLLTIMMVFSAVPQTALAVGEVSREDTMADETQTTEEQLAEAVKELMESGQFYMDASSARILEGESYTLRIARGGNDLPAASVRLSFIDITSHYGKDYTFGVRGDDQSQNPDQPAETAEDGAHDTADDRGSTSLMDEIAANPDEVVEVNGVDLAALSEEDLQAIYEEDSSELSGVVSKALEDYVAKNPDKYVVPAEKEEKTSSQSFLSKAFTKTTGLKDERMPMSSDGQAMLDFDSILSDYSVDTLKELTDELHSAGIVLDFAEGETEKLIDISAIEDEEAKGDLLFIAAILAESEDAPVSEYGSFTGEIMDNEEWDLPAIEFADSEYQAEDGYMNVTICRSGLTSVFSGVKIHTEDESATKGRDYSEVEMVVMFPAGISERTVSIPVRGDYVSEKAEFSLLLSEAENSRLGSQTTAKCIITPESGNYYKSKPVQKVTAEAGALRATSTSGGNPLDIPLNEGHFDFRPDSGCDAYYDSDGYVYLMANGNDVLKAKTRYSEYLNYNCRDDKRPYYAYSGLRVEWEKSGGGNSETGISLTYGTTPCFEEEINDNGWDRRTDTFYFNEPKDSILGYLDIYNTHNGSAYYNKSKLKVYKVELVPRKFEITASVKNDEELQFVNNEGNLVNYKEAKLAGVGAFTLSGQNDQGMTVKYTGDTVTINTDETYVYIKSLWIGSSKITPDYPSMTKSVSFTLDEDFLKKYGGKIEYKKVSGEYKGAFDIKVELGQYESEITLHNDDQRAELDFAFEANASGRKIVKGDYVAIRQTLKDEYSAAYTQSQVKLIVRKTTAEAADDFDPTFNRSIDGGDKNNTYAFRNDYTVVDAYPKVEDKNNQIIVRIKDEDIAKFNQEAGLFTKESIVNKTGYTDYIVVDTDEIQAGTRYELEAQPVDIHDVAIWKPAFKGSRYSQNNFWFPADSKAENNVVTLTCERGDEQPYSIRGRAFYSNVSLIGNAEGDAWMPAGDVVVQITPKAFGLTNEEGRFATVPMYGIEGCKVVYKVDAMGRTDYRTITLNTQETDVVSEIDTYSVSVGSFNVSPISKDVPYIAAAALISGKSNNGLIAYMGSQDEGIVNTFTVFIYNDNSVYTDIHGKEQHEVVQDVQLFAYDPLTNEQRGQICSYDDQNNPSKAIQVAPPDDQGRSIWQVTVDLKEGESFYKASDRIYVRLITNRIKAQAYDQDGNPVEGSSFKQTTYPDIYTGFVLSASDTVVPPTYDIDALDMDLTEFVDLPLFKKIDCTCLLKGFSMSFQLLPGNIHRFSIGKILNDHDYINDTKQEFDGFGDAIEKISEFGKKVKGKGHLGVKGGGVYPFVGIYIDFATKGVSTDQTGSLYLIGGGIYFGAQGNFRGSFYVPFVVPFYFGMDGDITAYANAGFHNTEDILYNTVRDGSAPLGDRLDPDFLFKAEGYIAGYAGFGLARTLGVRGGGSFYLQYMYYPTVRQTYPDYHKHGLRVTITVKIWADAYLFTIPIPVITLLDKPYGLMKDMENERSKQSPAKRADSQSGPVFREVTEPSEWMPKDSANGSSQQTDRLKSAPHMSGSQEIILQNGGFDHASPQLLDMGDNGVLMVFLSGDTQKNAGDESNLQYSIYRNGTWSTPERIGNEETFDTGDFQPNICDAGDKVMITWVSRKDQAYEGNLEYLGLMDIYTCMFDKTSHEITEIECLTDGDYLPKTGYDQVWLNDASPIGIYDEATGDRMVYYQKAEVVEKSEKELDKDLYNDFDEESKQILANASPTQNENIMVYMMYDHSRGKWNKDYIYEEEYADEDDRNYLIEEFGGQRFLMTPIDEGDMDTDTPTIIDFDAISYNGVGIYTYTIDRDNSLSTEYDRELFLQVYDFERHKTFHSIRITEDDVSDARPQLVRNYDENGDGHTWLFWLEGASIKNSEGEQDEGAAQIRYLDVAWLIRYGIDEKGNIGKTTTIDGESYTYDLAEEVHYLTYDKKDENDNPNFGSYTAYVDKEDNLYVTWLQQVKDDTTSSGDSPAAAFASQEIFASALIDRMNGTNWSDPVRLSYSGRVNDEVAIVVDKDNKLISVGNQYSIDPDTSDSRVSDLSLMMMTYEDMGSLKATEVIYSNEKPLAGENVTVTLHIRNTGLTRAEGYELEVYEMKNGIKGSRIYEHTYIDGEAGEQGTSVHEGIVPREIISESFSWDLPADLEDCETLSLYAEVTELGVENNATVSSELNGITISPEYVLKNVSVEQKQDKYLLNYEIENEGNVSYNSEDVSIVAKFNDLYKEGLEAIWLQEPIEPIAPKERVRFSKEIEISDEYMQYGVANGFLDILDKDGKGLGAGTGFIAAMEHPSEIIVNGDKELDTIRMNLGETLEITGDYGPKEFYQGGSVEFTVLNGEIAHLEGSRLVTDQPGTTTLRAYVVPFGGEKLITVVVDEPAEEDKAEAAAVDEIIEKLPAPDAVTPDDKDQIEAARAAYDALPPAAKALVDDTALRRAEEALYALMPKDQEVTVSKTSYTKTYGNAAFSLDAKTDGDGTIKYSSSNTKVVTVSTAGKVTIKGAGTAKITIYATEGEHYKKSPNVTVTVKVNKAANTLKVKGKTATVKYSALKKKAQTLKVSKVIKFTNKGKGKLTYTKKSGNKKITINKKTGKVTVKKGLKKGTYKVKVKVKAAGTKNYKALTKTVTFKIKVK